MMAHALDSLSPLKHYRIIGKPKKGERGVANFLAAAESKAHPKTGLGKAARKTLY